MSAHSMICSDKQSFNVSFGILLSLLLFLFILSIFVNSMLCVDNRRRKCQYKYKCKKAATREIHIAEELNRVLTYLAHLRKIGRLTSSAPSVDPKDALKLITDGTMSQHRKILAAEITLFFHAQESETKTDEDVQPKLVPIAKKGEDVQPKVGSPKLAPSAKKTSYQTQESSVEVSLISGKLK